MAYLEGKALDARITALSGFATVACMTHLQTLLRAVETDLGDPAGWGAPVEFPDSLALCALNSVYSLRATSASVVRVLERFRAVRPSANTDSGPDLLRAMDDAGSPERFARDVLENESKLPGTKRLRTVGIYEGLSRLAAPEVGVTTTALLREKAGDVVVKRAWRSVSGFGPLSWAYLLMNAGVVSETKPDVMIQRFVARSLGEDLDPHKTRQLLTEAAASLRVEPRSLDRAIWLHESPSAT